MNGSGYVVWRKCLNTTYTQTDYEPESVRKKMQQKNFAANVSREDIVRGAEDLGVELNEHIQFVIDTMAGIADELGLGSSRITQ